MLFIKELVKRYFDDEIPRLSAELAYYFLLSMFPFLMFLITLLGYLPIPQDQVFGVIEEFMPKKTMRLIESNLAYILNNQNGKLLSLSAIVAIWSASNGIGAIVRAFNRAYDVKESRSLLVAKGMAILLTFAMIFVILVSLLLPVFGKMIGVYIFNEFGKSEKFLSFWNTLRWGFSSIILFIVFTVLYFLAPNKRLKMKEVITGSIFATTGWIVVSLIFSYYVNHFGNYSAMYGSIGTIIVLMVWFYFSGMILVIGGEINGILNCRRVKDCT